MIRTLLEAQRRLLRLAFADKLSVGQEDFSHGKSTSPLLRVSLIALGAFWVISVCAGTVWLAHYSFAAAPPRRVVTHTWPGSFTQGPHPALVMSLHAYCPCSAASLGELSRILAKTRDRLSVELLFYRPKAEPLQWERNSLWQQASALPNVHLRSDSDGKEIRRFGLATSGETALYDVNGRLVFHGGITQARGHAGDNDGADTVVAFVNSGQLRRSSTPAFGCSLLGLELLAGTSGSVRVP